MEFINCGDQYCFTCLERYVEYWIKEGSWGLLPAELTCPVCGAEMLDDDWMPYISGRAIDLWHKFQVKRRENIRKLCINRSCPICNHSQPIMGSNHSININDFLIIGTQLASYFDSLKDLNLGDWRNFFDIETVLDLMKLKNSNVSFPSTEFIESSQDLFTDFLAFLDKLKRSGLFVPDNKDLIRMIIEFGRMFLRFVSNSIDSDDLSIAYFDEDYADIDEDETEDDGIERRFALINMQLNFQMTFPFTSCDICNLEFCLPCQYPEWFHPHHPQTSSSSRPDGSKQCPRCFVAIEKESDGCNEMRCNYCGMKFCWECGRKWSKDCGIYKCKQPETNINENVPRSEIESLTKYSLRDPEIGVPNVRVIHQSQGI